MTLAGFPSASCAELSSLSRTLPYFLWSHGRKLFSWLSCEHIPQPLCSFPLQSLLSTGFYPFWLPPAPRLLLHFFFSLPGQSPSSACMHAKLLQSCLSLLQLKDHSPPGSSVSELHRVNQWNLCCHGLCSRRKEDCVWYFLILLQHLSWCWFHSRHSANSHCGFKCI